MLRKFRVTKFSVKTFRAKKTKLKKFPKKYSY